MEDITKVAVIAVLVLFAGLANGIGDYIKFHNPWPYSNFWSENSWKNIYKNGDSQQGPRFIGSTSYFSFLCDGWHLMKTIWLELLCISIGIASGSILVYLIVRFAFWIGFETGYK